MKRNCAVIAHPDLTGKGYYFINQILRGSLPTISLTKPMLLFNKDDDSLCVLLNNIIPWKTQRPSTGLPILEDIQAILCPSVVSNVPLPLLWINSSDK
jgi:hypothetical protein